MANADAPFGLRPANTPQGGLKQRRVTLTAGATKIFKGDPVIAAAAGTYSIATAGALLGGVVMAIYDADGVPAKFYPGDSSAGYTAVICDDPDQEFLVQEDSGGGDLALADRGLNCNLVAGAGDETTGVSKWELDSSTAASTATLQCRIIDISETPDNAVGTNAVWRVRINYHFDRQTTGV